MLVEHRQNTFSDYESLNGAINCDGFLASKVEFKFGIWILQGDFFFQSKSIMLVCISWHFLARG